jgi:hypothetical protein
MVARSRVADGIIESMKAFKNHHSKAMDWLSKRGLQP